MGRREAAFSTMVPAVREIEHWDLNSSDGKRLGEIFRIVFGMGKEGGETWTKWLGLKADGQWSYSTTRSALAVWMQDKKGNRIGEMRERHTKPPAPEAAPGLPFGNGPADPGDEPKDTSNDKTTP
jgi:hypothetical protein